MGTLMPFDIDAALESIDFTSIDPSFSMLCLGPDPSLPSPDPLEEACANGDLQLTKKLLEGRSERRFGTALYLAIESKRHRIIEFLLSWGVPLGVGHIKVATTNKDIGALDILIKHGWDLNTPLEWAVPPPLSYASV